MDKIGMLTALTGKSDAELVQATKAGQKEAFDVLVERHYGLAHSIAFSRLKNVDGAEDVAQEAFVRAYLLLDRLESPKRFPAWLGRIARNLAIDRQRRGNRCVELFDMIPIDNLPDDPADETPDARQAAASMEEHDALYDALKKLPPEQLEIVLLHYMEGMTHREIGKRLGVSASTVTRRLKSCMKELRKEMDPALRESLSRIRPGMKARAKTVALVGIVASLPEPSRAALAKAAAPALEGGLGSSMEYSLLKGSFATKAKVFGAFATVAAGIAVAAFIFFQNTEDGRPLMFPNHQMQEATSRDTTTPEGTVALFTQSLARGDQDAIVSYMAPDSTKLVGVKAIYDAPQGSLLGNAAEKWGEIDPNKAPRNVNLSIDGDIATITWEAPRLEGNKSIGFEAKLVRVDGQWLVSEF